MKAAVYDENGGPEVLRYADVPDPRGAPRRAGDRGQGDRHPGRRPHQPARGSARELARTSSATRPAASSARSARASTRSRRASASSSMMMHGSHAELASVTARKTWPIPDSFSFEDASAVPVEFGTADDCLFEFGRLHGRRARARPGRCRRRRPRRDPAGQGRRRDRASRRRPPTGGWNGCTTTASTTASTTRRQDVPAEVMRLTDGRGVDLVVDPIGGRALEGSIAALAYRGRISWMGNAGRDDHPPRIWPLMEKNGIDHDRVLRHGAVEAARTHLPVIARPHRTHRHAASCAPSSIASFPLADAAEAHRYVEAGTAFGRVVMVP